MKYRPEIDGLRAVAVVPVIAFHADFAGFSGGFVGVDVFFVISGYLISTILFDDIAANRFSIVRFYERRARRILPALFVVTLATLAAGWVFLDGAAQVDLGKSVVSVGVFLSNVYFWRSADYFSLGAEYKPLLHTWSLAVEEQFYLLFPIFLWLAKGLRRRWLLASFVGIGLASLGLAEWGWREAPTASFYLAPTRAWELTAGAVAALVVRARGVAANDLYALPGLLAIVFAIFAYDRDTPFPSVYGLVPVLGVTLIAVFGGQGSLTARLLGWKPFVALGLVSYSAYLWHQPLLVYTRYHVFSQDLGINLPPEALPLTARFAVLAATMVLAGLTWRFVEQPFRRRRPATAPRPALWKRWYVAAAFGVGGADRGRRPVLGLPPAAARQRAGSADRLERRDPAT